jgi:tol-pal system protein YbgF
MAQRTVATLVALFALGAPLAASDKEHQQLMADIRMLQVQSQQLQMMLNTLNDTLRSLNTRIDEQSNQTRKSFADQKVLADAAGADIRVVREKLDDANVRIASLSQELEALRRAMPPPGSVVVQPGASPVDPATGAPVPPPVESAAPPVNPGVSPQQIFRAAEADYQIGQWALAVEGFETFLKTFPKSERAPEAQFYIGQVRYAEGKFKEAIEAYDLVIARYSTSPRVADAYYKRGLSFDRLGQPDRAREAFEFVLKNYPDSDAAGLSRQGLDRLKEKKPNDFE